MELTSDNYPPRLTAADDAAIEARISNEKKSTGVAYLLLFIFGGFGVHRFYLGYPNSGAVLLLLTVVSLFMIPMWGILGLLAVWVWIIIDLFTIPSMNRKQQAILRRSLEEGRRARL